MELECATAFEAINSMGAGPHQLRGTLGGTTLPHKRRPGKGTSAERTAFGTVV